MQRISVNSHNIRDPFLFRAGGMRHSVLFLFFSYLSDTVRADNDQRNGPAPDDKSRPGRRHLFARPDQAAKRKPVEPAAGRNPGGWAGQQAVGGNHAAAQADGRDRRQADHLARHEALRTYGMNEFVVALGYKGEAVMRYFLDLHYAQQRPHGPHARRLRHLSRASNTSPTGRSTSSTPAPTR